MLKTKKGRIIFFSISALFIVTLVVLLTVFMPEPGLLDAKDSFNTAISYYSKNEKRSAASYMWELNNVDKISAEDASALKRYNYIIVNLGNFDEYFNDSLTFTYRSDSYKEEVKNLNKSKDELASLYQNFYEWAHSSLSRFLKIQTKSSADTKIYAGICIEKLEKITIATAKVYNYAFEVLKNSCERGYAVNDNAVAYLGGVVSASLRVASEASDELVSQLVSTIDNYKRYMKDYSVSPELVETITAAFDAIAPLKEEK